MRSNSLITIMFRRAGVFGLATIAAWGQAGLGDASLEQLQYVVDLGLWQNPLGQPVPHPGQAESASDIEGQVSDAVAEGQQALEGGKDAVTAGGGQCTERIGEALEIGKGDRGERLPFPAMEAGDVGSVGALGVNGAAVEPDIDQVIVGMGLQENWHFREGFNRPETAISGGIAKFYHERRITFHSFKKVVFCAGAH
jgi:hypothetical protein